MFWDLLDCVDLSIENKWQHYDVEWNDDSLQTVLYHSTCSKDHLCCGECHPLQPKHTLAQRHFCPITSLFYLFNSKIKETYGPQQFCQRLFRWKILIFWHYMVKKSGWKYFHCSQLPNQWTWNTFIYSVVQSVNWKYFHCMQSAVVQSVNLILDRHGYLQW